ncbi:MAG: hypothetical protein LJE64_02880 [Desulfofustis sp.]|nr:hypothetical protein [Desulfofustis sp.]
MGPITAKTIVNAGLKVDVMPQEHTIDAMVREIISYYSDRNTSIT